MRLKKKVLELMVDATITIARRLRDARGRNAAGFFPRIPRPDEGA